MPLRTARPRMNANDVIRIGRSRIADAYIAAAQAGVLVLRGPAGGVELPCASSRQRRFAGAGARQGGQALPALTTPNRLELSPNISSRLGGRRRRGRNGLGSVPRAAYRRNTFRMESCYNVSRRESTTCRAPGRIARAESAETVAEHRQPPRGRRRNDRVQLLEGAFPRNAVVVFDLACALKEPEVHEGVGPTGLQQGGGPRDLATAGTMNRDLPVVILSVPAAARRWVAPSATGPLWPSCLRLRLYHPLNSSPDGPYIPGTGMSFRRR
jgi:hypothetical protein